MFRVEIPFGPFDAGDSLTPETILNAVPGCDLARLVRLGSLVPLDGFDVGTLADPTASQEQAEDVIAELHAKVLAAGDVIAELHAKYREHFATLAKGTMNLEALADITDGPKAGDVFAPSVVAERLADLLDAGAVGWTAKPLTGSPAPGEDDTKEIVTPAGTPPEPTPPAEPTPTAPASKRKK